MDEFEESKKLVIEDIKRADCPEQLLLTAGAIIMCYWPKSLKKAQEFMAKFYEVNELERAKMHGDCDE